MNYRNIGIAILLICVPLTLVAKGKGETLRNLNCETNQIAKYDGANWVCSNDKIGPWPSWVMLDSNGNPVGEVLNFIRADTILIRLQFEQREVITRATIAWNGPGNDESNGGLLASNALKRWLTPDCTGQVFAQAWFATGGTGTAITASWLDPFAEDPIYLLKDVYFTFDPGQELIPFVRNGEKIVVSTAEQFEKVVGDAPNETWCFPVVRDEEDPVFDTVLWPVVAVAGDLSETYPPPYTVIRQ